MRGDSPFAPTVPLREEAEPRREDAVTTACCKRREDERVLIGVEATLLLASKASASESVEDTDAWLRGRGNNGSGIGTERKRGLADTGELYPDRLKSP